MLLTIDIGNTRIKAAVFECDTLLEFFVFDKENFEKKIKNIFQKHDKIDNLVIASVGNTDLKLIERVNSVVKTHIITKDSYFPFQNLYQTPHTLGVDRMVLSSGAVLQYPNQNRLVIDAGTCVTYDFIDSNDNYLGGAISPGLRLRYESLHNYTAKLPLLTLERPKDVVGTSTAESIHSGVVNGLAFEIDGFIDHYKGKYSNFITILTGGDTEILAKRLKNTIFANPNFLLESLNQTYQYNQK
jgi:type III pantothenate kinase